MLIKSDLSGGPGSLRELIGAGEPLNPEVIAQVQQQWGMTLRDGYGQTEMTAAVGNTPGATVKPGSMGRPLPGVPVVLVDPATGEVAPDEGELCLDLGGEQGRPLPLMTGYQGDRVRDDEATAGGFYHTGDLVSRDEDGYITYVGRTDDVFKASDYKVSPFELESVLIEHPAVAEAAIVPAPDPVRLAVPKAYVALAAGHEPTRETALAILTFARDHLPPYLRIRRLEFAELPKTISGKIRRVELRQREDDAAHGGAVGRRRVPLRGLRGAPRALRSPPQGTVLEQGWEADHVGSLPGMGYGLGVALLVIGLILALAVEFDVAGLDIHVIGWILVIGGIAVIALTAVQLNTRRRQTTVATTTDAHGRQATTERRTESDPPPPPAI